MKKISFLFILTFLLGASVNAQEYIPVIQEGSFWDVIVTGPGECAPMTKYRIGNDFIHNGIVYKNIESAPIQSDSGDIHCPFGNLHVNEEDFQSSNAYIREDIDEKKVYILVWIENEYREFTMADFSLEVGDVMTNAFAPDIHDPDGDLGGDLMVVQIDVLSDGRKQFYLEDGREMYVEGVGNFQGPTYMYRPYVLYEDAHNISCYGNDDTDNSNCIPTVLSTDDYRLSQIKLFPNPTSDKIYFSNLGNNTFKLYSILGKEMPFTFLVENQSIDISHLRNGIYFLEIQGANQTKRTLKVLKN